MVGPVETNDLQQVRRRSVGGGCTALEVVLNSRGRTPNWAASSTSNQPE